MYERKVIYLFQYHGNTAGKNVGYIKWNRSQEEGKLILNIKGLHLTKEMIGECSILFEKKKIRLGKVYLKNAVAEGKYFIDSELCKQMEEKNSSPEGVLVEFGDVRCAAGFSSEFDLDAYLHSEVPSGLRNEKESLEEEQEVLQDTSDTSNTPGTSEIPNIPDTLEIPETPVNMPVIEPTEEQQTLPWHQMQGNAEKKIERQEPDNEDMFGRLKELFPSVHPFEKVENKEYLSITPREIEFFKKEYITLVNNSFLLHGYQNYKYLILGRDLDFDIYSIGVPGVYYEKEEMMAKMFGFNKFIPALSGEVAQGSFGYYTKVLG